MSAAPPELKASPLAAALAKAQGAFGPIHRDKTVKVTLKAGGSYSFDYAPLESILRAVMPALSANGLALSQSIGIWEGKEVVRTELLHAQGESMFNHVRIMTGDSGPQAYGSALTYARRYGITLLLCVCADDGGNAAEGHEAQVTHQRLEADSTQTARNALDGAELSAAKRKAYLPQIVSYLTAEDGLAMRQLWDELTQREQAGLWALLSTQQKSTVRTLLQTKSNGPVHQPAVACTFGRRAALHLSRRVLRR